MLYQLKHVETGVTFTYCHYLPLLPLRSVTWGRCIRLKVCHLALATCTDGEPQLGLCPCEAGHTTKARGSVGCFSWAGSLGRRGWRGCIQLLLGFLWFGLPGDGLDSLHQSKVSDQWKDQALSETEQNRAERRRNSRNVFWCILMILMDLSMSFWSFLPLCTMDALALK